MLTLLKTKIEEVLTDLKTLEKAINPIEVEQKITKLQTSSSIEDLKQLRLLYKQLEEYKSLEKQYLHLYDLILIAIELDETSAYDMLFDEVNDLKEALSAAIVAATLNGKYDNCSAIVTLHAGAGGTEAQDWCDMLHRMYMRWAIGKDYKVDVLDYGEGDTAGIKTVTFLVEGLNAYGYLKCEKGVHRLVRISPFDAAGRRHTSFASVEVIPDIEDVEEVVINPEELKIDTYRSSGAGGQHINKTESAIRITHLPTGIVVTCQTERSQHKNRASAMKVLSAKLAVLAEERRQAELDALRGEAAANAWGSQIRSYIFCPYTLVKDHRTNVETGSITKVMDGDIDPFINAVLLQ